MAYLNHIKKAEYILTSYDSKIWGTLKSFSKFSQIKSNSSEHINEHITFAYHLVNSAVFICMLSWQSSFRVCNFIYFEVSYCFGEKLNLWCVFLSLTPSKSPEVFFFFPIGWYVLFKTSYLDSTHFQNSEMFYSIPHSVFYCNKSAKQLNHCNLCVQLFRLFDSKLISY